MSEGDPPASRARFFPSFFCFLAPRGMGVTVGSPSCCQRMRRACCAWSARSQMSESGSLKLRQLAHTRSTSPNTSPSKKGLFKSSRDKCQSQDCISCNNGPTPDPHSPAPHLQDKASFLSQVTHVTVSFITAPTGSTPALHLHISHLGHASGRSGMRA